MPGTHNTLMLGAALFLAMVGCAELANTTRTGTIHQVRFEQRMTPAELWVQPGDEVRWINQRSMPVTLEFLGGALDEVSCESGFSNRGLANLMGRRREEIEIEPNESASLCFTGAGTVTYNARMDSAIAGGQTIESGTIHISQ
jgi:plastocyanin